MWLRVNLQSLKVVEINPIFRNFFYTTQKFPSPSGPPREFLHFRRKV